MVGVILLGHGAAWAGVAKIAVASNFQAPAKQLVAAFEQETGDRIKLSFGSTGLFYAQIRHGAPFDAFFAADVERPRRLEQDGAIVPGSRFTYAEGKLVLWSTKPDYMLGNGNVLREGGYEHIALANPKLAPYGLAAQQTLRKLGLWETLQRGDRLVMGQNIGQTHQLIASGSVSLGFMALSQIQRPGQAVQGSYWPVPSTFYEPIVQQAVLIQDIPVARAFLEFIRGPRAGQIIQSYGYEVPAGINKPHRVVVAE
ncbi:molybdenum ABC transporter, substrate binding periplasmic protein ModA [Nitrococcus mobilis Nb-231]|uniref:Molybdenum ABC transporter, substrate binding periplasmic protein ModA n=1 Tax=Nitrococcus mobilis Nb-231 TaxID=314278 RepID=A4BNW8_9GAMM|nr:molybdenum ABC transporter, substrate binding periplasmic protein ModA [Nitrococcus mobilis Nb-231]